MTLSSVSPSFFVYNETGQCNHLNKVELLNTLNILVATMLAVEIQLNGPR